LRERELVRERVRESERERERGVSCERVRDFKGCGAQMKIKHPDQSVGPVAQTVGPV